MKVRMQVQVSGGRPDGTPWPAVGEVLEVSDAEGAELCRSDPHSDVALAVPVVEERKVEKAVAPEPETREEKKAKGPELPPPPPAPEPKPVPKPASKPEPRTTRNITSLRK